MNHPPRISLAAALLLTLAGSSSGLQSRVDAQEVGPSIVPIEVAPAAPEAPIVAAKPRVQVCFVLDTTGSMSGLIEGAKRKIWTIANQIIEAEPTPDLEVSLLAYRDRGDDYITTIFDLTNDMDAVYAKLASFSANGGGDGPESVNQALHEAVDKIAWSEGEDVLRLIFLVGDAPPHMDYEDDVKYLDTCGSARGKDIIVNAVQCGSMGGTTEIWQEIANATGGSYVAIQQDGGMTAIETPMDAELAKLNAALGETIIAYGSDDMRRGVHAKQSVSEGVAMEAAAARLSYNAAMDCVVQGGGDLIDALDQSLVTVDKLQLDWLPEDLQSLDSAQLIAHIDAKRAERNAVQMRINTLLTERQAHIDAERKRLAGEGKGDAFDAKVLEILKEQAATKGLSYEEEEVTEESATVEE
jgi:Mg-chelatase subunit ChlD